MPLKSKEETMKFFEPNSDLTDLTVVHHRDKCLNDHLNKYKSGPRNDRNDNSDMNGTNDWKNSRLKNRNGDNKSDEELTWEKVGQNINRSDNKMQKIPMYQNNSRFFNKDSRLTNRDMMVRTESQSGARKYDFSSISKEIGSSKDVQDRKNMVENEINFPTTHKDIESTTPMAKIQLSSILKDSLNDTDKRDNNRTDEKRRLDFTSDRQFFDKSLSVKYNFSGLLDSKPSNYSNNNSSSLPVNTRFDALKESDQKSSFTKLNNWNQNNREKIETTQVMKNTKFLEKSFDTNHENSINDVSLPSFKSEIKSEMPKRTLESLMKSSNQEFEIEGKKVEPIENLKKSVDKNVVIPSVENQDSEELCKLQEIKLYRTRLYQGSLLFGTVDDATKVNEIVAQIFDDKVSSDKFIDEINEAEFSIDIYQSTLVFSIIYANLYYKAMEIFAKASDQGKLDDDFDVQILYSDLEKYSLKTKKLIEVFTNHFNSQEYLNLIKFQELARLPTGAGLNRLTKNLNLATFVLDSLIRIDYINETDLKEWLASLDDKCEHRFDYIARITSFLKRFEPDKEEYLNEQEDEDW